MTKKKKQKTGIIRTILNLFLFAIMMVGLMFTVWWKKLKEKKDRSA